MTSIVIREGVYIGYNDDHGYVYQLNASLYAYKNGTTRLLGNINNNQ